MKYRILTIYAALALISFSSCKNEQKEEKEKDKTEELSKNNAEQQISIEPLEESPAYKDSGLKLTFPENNQFSKNNIAFKFEVENYQLGVQTSKNEITSKLANSNKGQHIHFIVDNDPYSAHYETEFSKDLSDGTHHIVAFLSRSYHESVKNDQSFITKTIKIGDNPDTRSKVDFNKPTLIYSRPKGEYVGEDTKNVLLDFFLLNTSLAEDGNYVKATINDSTFEITKWQPYIIKGLSKGEVHIRLQLFDQNNQPIEGEYNDVARSVVLK
ncbi:hypothetical protein [Zunongwangia endophytica]|uniref:Phosphopeptide-binding protein n=1 Tax=Zunongwangia endophytica TaxID=1808945 RepID=A0ABV8HF20_9FLAO|nr:hypothetical protein [Zunongwangia endophytica]MDN3596897.1 hypothetical protein [Zunongwangia endophytica]